MLGRTATASGPQLGRHRASLVARSPPVPPSPPECPAPDCPPAFAPLGAALPLAPPLPPVSAESTVSASQATAASQARALTSSLFTLPMFIPRSQLEKPDESAMAGATRQYRAYDDREPNQLSAFRTATKLRTFAISGGQTSASDRSLVGHPRCSRSRENHSDLGSRGPLDRALGGPQCAQLRIANVACLGLADPAIATLAIAKAPEDVGTLDDAGMRGAVYGGQRLPRMEARRRKDGARATSTTTTVSFALWSSRALWLPRVRSPLGVAWVARVPQSDLDRAQNLNAPAEPEPNLAFSTDTGY